MTSIRAHIAMLAFVIIFGASYSARAAGFDITEFYTGKTITFIVGLQNTSYARTMGRHMMKYVPGNPSLKFQMMPGMGSRYAAAAIAGLAPGNGLAIAALLPEAIMELLASAAVKKENTIRWS